MFKKIVGIEPLNLTEWGEQELWNYAEKVVLYTDRPADDAEILRRIDDADAVLVSYTSKITANVLKDTPNVKYIGMCCSLYTKESANVDIAFAEEHGIQVKGIRDYGDRGVVEFVLYELVKLLHAYDNTTFVETPEEIYKKKVGIVGLGVSGTMIGETLSFLGAEVSYYSRSRKPEKEAQGFKYKDLHTLLRESDIIFTSLNKNVILLHEEEFTQMGNGKILFNTSIGPGHDEDALANWLQNPTNYIVADTYAAIGNNADQLIHLPNVISPNKSAGRTTQAFELMTQKVLTNIKEALGN